MPRVSKGTRQNTSHKPSASPEKFQTGFLLQLDKRGRVYKALSGMQDDIRRDLGGDTEISTLKGVLVEKAVWLYAMLCSIESQISTGEMPLDTGLGKWSQATNTLIGLTRVLGVSKDSNVWQTIDNGEDDAED